MATTQTTRPQGRPLTDRRMYYSLDHRKVLRFCATQANRRLWREHNLRVDPEELMEEGWWLALRRRPPSDLKPAIKNTIRLMFSYALNFYLFHNGCRRAQSLEDLEYGCRLEEIL